MKWMGIDGGGTLLRVGIVDDNMQEIALITSGRANPSSIGYVAAAQNIQQTVRQALALADLTRVDGVAIGIAGAENAADWLVETLESVLPDTLIIPSSDVEIALVGARGKLDGILLLAGTGSIALGINPQGQRQRIGGWGYLLGDEGSGYWLGTQALKILTQWLDGLYPTKTMLPEVLMTHLGLEKPLDIITWRYHQSSPTDVAALAPLVIQLAEQKDIAATDLIAEAANYFAQIAQVLLKNLNLTTESIVFAGSLLSNSTLLQKQVCAKLNLSEPKMPLYPPVVGAALLAKLNGGSHAD